MLNRERVIEGMFASLVSLGPVMMLLGETMEKSGTPESLLVCRFRSLEASNGLASKGAIRLWVRDIPAALLFFLVSNLLMFWNLSFSVGNLRFWKQDTPPVSPLWDSILRKLSAVMGPDRLFSRLVMVDKFGLFLSFLSAKKSTLSTGPLEIERARYWLMVLLVWTMSGVKVLSTAALEGIAFWLMCLTGEMPARFVISGIIFGSFALCLSFLSSF